jgi:uncharacterized surface protein with fasciclin (FAS1) repeats
MNPIFKIITIVILLSSVGCKSGVENKEIPVSGASSIVTPTVGQSGVKDDVSNPNIVQVAVGSKDHTTLVAAVQAAGLVDALSNAGPFTVFAPTNDAFGKLPAGTVEGLLKPEKLADLKNILEYHTYVGSLKTDYMEDGQSFEQVNGGKITISKKDGKLMVNGKATVLASIPTSNGIIHVIDEVLLPQ